MITSSRIALFGTGILIALVIGLKIHSDATRIPTPTLTAIPKITVAHTKDVLVISPQFDEISWLSEGLIKVVINGKWAFIDPTGNVVVQQRSILILLAIFLKD